MVYIYVIITAVCFFSSVIGSICGIGGGVIIKPVLDATGIMAVDTVSFLSGCTVLSMSAMSMYKNFKREEKTAFNKRFATVLATGSVIGGIAGKSAFQVLSGCFSSVNKIGAVQAGVLAVITFATFVYTVFKQWIRTKHIDNRIITFVIGILLGMMSSFLGIGGGPINLIVLFYFFSLETKQAAIYSLYIIMFSQIASLGSTLLGKSVPEFRKEILGLMILCGVLGGIVGSKINAKIENKIIDKLFMILILIIIAISVYNVFHYLYPKGIP
ncbi:sulfite exporter TauE/SafE family protein [Roseburia hominis]